MDFALFENDTPRNSTDVFNGPQTGLLKTTGFGFMRGGIKTAKAGALAGSVLFPSEGEAEKEADRIIPRKEDFFRFIDERLTPAEKFWTPDPESLTTAGKVVGALAELPLQLVGGSTGMVTTITGNTGIDLVNQDVDAGTAGAVAAGMGVATTAMVAMPQAGNTLLKTGLLALLNPVTGAATDLAANKALESQGYKEQAKMFDPFDPAARSVDLALGVIFGGVAHYGRWREKAPTAVVDAIDTVEKHKHAENSNPFTPDTPQAQAHGEALAGALDALDEGKPVDVAGKFDGAAAPKESSYTADRFRQDIRDVFGVDDEQADAALALVAARARVEGKDLDGWIAKNLAGVEHGALDMAELFQDRPMVQPFYSKVLAEVENLQQEKWSGPELLAKLKKTAGVKGEELAWTGLDGFLSERPRVTREEVRGFLAENQVKVQEVLKGFTAKDAADRAIRDFREYSRSGGYSPGETKDFEIELWRGDTKPEDMPEYLRQKSVALVEALRARDAMEEQNIGRPEYPTQVLPGGENYRELLLTLPDKGFAENYYGQHWKEENVLAHVRFNERTGANGERILHLEEVQSDWHQAGRDKGYSANVPEAPFAKTWHELSLKRMLRWAAENGFDRMTWTTGEQQAARYDLSKKLDEITYSKGRNGNWQIEGYRDGSTVLSHSIPDTALPDAVGKDMAAKIRRGEGAERYPGSSLEVKSLKGLDLRIGGEGMAGFYDRMLPQFLDKFGKKFGAKVEPSSIATRTKDFGEFEAQHRKMYPDATAAEVKEAYAKFTKAETVHSIPITDQMRNALLYEGQPLFQGEKGAVSFLADGRAVIHALEAPDFSTLVHELSHVFEKSLSPLERKGFDTWLHSQVPGAKWSTGQREAFARAFERYLAEGKAPVAELQGVFDKFKNWLLEVYQRITGTALDVRMNDNVRALFDRMLFADKLRQAADPAAAKLRQDLQPHMEEMKTELRDTWGDDEEPELPAARPAQEPEPPQPSPMTGPLGDAIDVANTFARNPRQVPEMLKTFLDHEAGALEKSESGKVVIDGYQKSATWSDAGDWFLERNRAMREQGASAVSKSSTVSALRKAAKGEYETLTPGQKDMVLAAVDRISQQIHGMSREITGGELKPGDSFTTTHLEQRVVVGEREGRVILDSGEVIPMDKTLRVVGEIDSTGRPGEAPGTAADIILQARGDFEIADGLNTDGSPRLRSASEMLAEARDAIVIEQNRKPLYHRAAVCLGLG